MRKLFFHFHKLGSYMTVIDVRCEAHTKLEFLHHEKISSQLHTVSSERKYSLWNRLSTQKGGSYTLQQRKCKGKCTYYQMKNISCKIYGGNERTDSHMNTLEGKGHKCQIKNSYWDIYFSRRPFGTAWYI